MVAEEKLMVTTNEPAYAKATARQARIDTNFRTEG